MKEYILEQLDPICRLFYDLKSQIKQISLYTQFSVSSLFCSNISTMQKRVALAFMDWINLLSLSRHCTKVLGSESTYCKKRHNMSFGKFEWWGRITFISTPFSSMTPFFFLFFFFKTSEWRRQIESLECITQKTVELFQLKSHGSIDT